MQQSRRMSSNSEGIFDGMFRAVRSSVTADGVEASGCGDAGTQFMDCWVDWGWWWWWRFGRSGMVQLYVRVTVLRVSDRWWWRLEVGAKNGRIAAPSPLSQPEESSSSWLTSLTSSSSIS